MGLACMNCKQDVPSADAKFFAECFVCPACYAVAERVFTQSQQELKHLLVALKELIRLAIVHGELQLPAAADGKLSKQTFVDVIAGIARKQEPDCPTPPPRSTESSWRQTTRLPALTVGGSSSSASTREVPFGPETASTPTAAAESPDNA